MIRKWFKKLIGETIKENFPACHITIKASDKSNIKLKIKGGTFVGSHIKISRDFLAETVELSECYVEQGEEPFISHGVPGEELEAKIK